MIFAGEYLVDFDGKAAAIRAGYAPKAAKQTAHKLLKDPEVKAFVEKHRAKVAKRYEITADRVLQELASVAYEPLKRARKGKIVGAKVRALAQLGKHLGISAPDKIAFTTPTGEALPVSYVFVGAGRGKPSTEGDAK
jgi:phage terminase small subunit